MFVVTSGNPTALPSTSIERLQGGRRRRGEEGGAGLGWLGGEGAEKKPTKDCYSRVENINVSSVVV